MTKAVFRKGLNSLVPAEIAAEEALRRIAHGTDVMVEIKQPRNLRHHKKFWALMRLVFENQDYYESPKKVCEAFKIAVGHYDTYRVKGIDYIVPKSIAFHNMDQSSFNEFYKKALDFCVNTVIPGLGKEQLGAEVEGYL